MARKGRFEGGVGPRKDRVGPDLRALYERFWSYAPVNRNFERHGIFEWDSEPDGDSRANLHIHEQPDHGFAFEWLLSTPERPRWRVLNSVGDPSQLSEDDWIDAADESFILTGNFVPLKTAWAIIEDFFADPLTPSPRVKWIDVQDMPERPVP